ncbi:uncharacterized protein LOC132842608 isoform X3 [Tachysurus vachellii]|uniref:uncharacterized protein LOC132842608 isoform X3 n=1 Tax=Tachysurus vachellii TaxID=175792 RepID=UPI00296A8F4A|nr:uncharacterized protein LOC132842608 isoform X3 [Tachysurus vachellii]
MASSNQDASQYLRDAHENLVKQLQNLPLIVRRLHQQNVLNTDEVSELKDEHEKRKYSRKILDLVLNKGEEACYEFLRILDRERNSVFPNPDSSSLTPDLHTWICLFSFTDEAEDVYIYGPTSCHKLQNLLKTSVKQQPEKSLQFYGGKVQHNFTFIPLVLDTDTEKNKPHNKIILKSKKCKKPRLKNMKSYIPKDTQRKSPEDLLNSSEKSILIVGKPGIGKTTVVQQMLHHWAERSDRNLDFMFYFDENTLSNISTTESLENLLLSKYLMLNPQLKENAEEILQYLQLYSDSVTIVFDGIRDFQENRFLLEIMEHELLPEAKIVTTCRPEVEYEFSDWTTCKVYVQGFSEESIYDFFRKMSVNEPELVDIVINNPALFSLCHVPMHAFMVAACISYYTSEEAQKHFTATELYVRIFRHCLQRQGKKEFLDLDGHIKHCRDMVLSLAESAFNATKLKTINLEFDYDERGISGAFLKTVSAVSRARISCAFLHNTMQEFFSALWLLEKSEILDEVLNLCQNEDSEHMKHIIPFLCGLQSQTIIDHLKCLFPLNKIKDNIDVFFEKVLNTFIGEQPDDENTDIAFICQCLYEFQSPETCCSFLERINYHLDLSEEHLDPYTCCAVSYVIRQSTNTQVHLDMENSAVSLSGLKIILQHSHYLRDFSTTLSQIWTIALKCEELNYLRNLLQLCRNEIHIPMSSQTDVLEQAGKFITRYAEQPNLHLHCDKDPQQLTDLFLSTVFSWLPHISSLNFTSTLGESKENCQQKCMPFKLDLCLQAFLYQREENIWKTVEKIMSNICKERSDFLLDLFSHVKQYESKTHRTVLPALLPVYQSLPVWSINLSERKVSDLLEVLKLQTQKIPVELRDCSDEESEVRSFLQCLPYISHLSFNDFHFTDGEKKKKWTKFLLDLCLQTALHQPQNIQETVKKVMTDYYEEQSDFLLDLFSQLKQYESKTHRTVLPALLTVYQSLPVWSINLSERKVSVLLEVLKLQTQKIPVKLSDCSDEESEVRSFLQCLPYISHLSFNDFYFTDGEKKKKWRKFLLDLCLQTALHQPQNIQETVKKVMTEIEEYEEEEDYYEEQSDFLLDLFSQLKQYESKTHRTVLPALLTVYQSLPVWSINLSERKVSDLLEVLKLQTQKIPVKLRDCSGEESEVRSLLQCLPYISHLSFNVFYFTDGEKKKKWRKFLLDLCLQTALHQPQNIQETVKKVMTDYYEEQSDFLLDLFSHVKQYESKTHRTVLPALLTVYQSLPVWSINLSERKVSDLLEVLKLQTQKIPVKLRDCSDEESEVRSFLQCLPYISHLSFNDLYSQRKKHTEFLMNLFHHTTESDRHTGGKSLELLASVCNHTSFPYGENSTVYNSDFLLDLFSHVKQYESKTHRTVLPVLLTVYQSLPVWSINLSERKVSVLLEVLKLQTQKIPVELRDCSDEESEVRSFLQCLPYISHLRFNESHFTDGEKKKRWRKFLLDLCLQTAQNQPQNIQETVKKVMTDYYEEQSEFLLDLFSHVKQYESKTHRTVLPALLPVYQSLPVWSINLSERKVSVLLEVLKLQTQKIPVELRDCSDEESEVRSFLRCLPYISHLSFNESHFTEEEKKKRWRKFLLDLCLQTALHQPQNIQETVKKVMTDYYEEQSDFLLDLFSHVKQYESKTHRTVLPALLTVYQSVPVWSIKLSERKVSDLLEVLKLQTQKIPVELRDCSDEESEVRSFLQCLPYISQLRFKQFYSASASIQFMVNLIIAAVDCLSDKGESFTELLVSVCSYNTFPFRQDFHAFHVKRSEFLLYLFSHVKQYESKTHRTVLPILLTVYQSLPAVRFKEFYFTDEEKKKRWRKFLMDLCLQTALHQPQNIQQTVKKVMTDYYEEQSDFLLDLFSHVKQYESKTHRTVLPALLTVYQSLPVWSIKLSERKVSDLLEVLKLQTQKIPVELRDCSDEESEVRSFLQCLPYISHLSFNEFYSASASIQFMVNLIIAAVDCLSDKGESFTELLVSVCSYNTFPFRQDFHAFHVKRSEFLLYLFSHVKQYESKTHRTVLPILLTVYQSLPAVRFKEFYFTDEEKKKRWRKFLMDLCLQTALHQPQNIQQTVKKVMTDYYEEQSDFLLDLFSHVKQYESKTHRTVLPALLTVYQSLPVWSIKLSERKVSDLLEVLKLQTQKIPVELRDCSDEESEVRSFLQCLPYISHLSFNEFYSASASIQFMVNLIIAAVDCQSDKGESFTELLVSVCSYNTFPFRQDFHAFHVKRSEFLLYLFSHVKQYESKTHRTVLPILLTVYQSLPAVRFKEFYFTDEEKKKRWRKFLMDLCLQTALHQPQNIQQTVKKVMTDYYEEQSDFLLDLFSHVKQYESKTHRTVLPALLTVYQSLPVWSIKLSERKVSDLLEVLKLQTQKKPVELRDCSDEESEVRSFLQCLPYISHLSFNEFYSASASIQFMVNLIIAAVDCQSDKGESFTELLVSVCSYNTFPFRQDFHGFHEVQSEFLLYLFSHVKQYESKTHRTVLPILLTVYQSLPAVRFNVFYFTDREKKKKWRKFLLDLCLQTAQHQPQNIQETVEKVMTGIEYYEEDEDYYEEQSDFLLDLFSHVKQYESKTHRTVLPVLLPVYQSLPVWSINLSERKVSVLLEVLKLQTQKKPVELRDCSDEESEVRSFLQCLPYISHLSFNEFYSASAYVQFMMNLIIAAVDCQSDKGESFTELLVSVCSYNTFPFRQEFHGFHEEQSEFLLDLFSHVKQYESKTHRTVLPVLLPVYQSLPVWSINLSERKVSVLLEVLKLQTQKKPVELRDCSGEESEVRSFLQCLPYISQLRCDSWLIPRLSKAVVDHAEDTELVRAFFAAMDFVLIIDWVLTTREYRAVRKLLNLSDSSLKLALKPQAISLRGARLLFRHITHLQKLCLSERVLVRMIRAVRAGGSFRSSESRWVIQELCLDFNIINPKIFRYLSSLSSLLNLWTVHCVNLTGCRMEAHSLLSLMCHPGLLKIRLSKSTLQQFTDLLYEAQDGELTRLFLEKVGGDLTSCSLSWEELIYLLQQRVCCISVNIRKNKITHKHTREILPLLSEIQFKRLNPSVLLSIIREIYETDSAHYVSSLLKSTQNCINLNNTDLDSCHCTALCFTLQHCTSVSLSLMWTSIPDGELVKILPLFNRLSQLSVDRFLLLKLLHCCSISELQQGAAAAVFSALQNRLDFSCSTGLDLSTETQDKTLHLSTEDCRDISTAIQKSQQRTELILEDCELEDTGVDVFLLILHTVTLRCSKSLLLRFLALLRLVNQSDCVMNAMSLSKALNGDMDLSKTPLDLGACRSLALFLEFSEGLSELDLSHCKLTDQGLELLLPHLHKVEVLDLSHNDIDDCLAGRIYTVVSISSNIQTVRLFNNRITDKETFQKDKRFEIW